MSRHLEDDGLRPEYDFSEGVRGKHYRAYRRGTTIVHSKQGETETSSRMTGEQGANKEVLETLKQSLKSANERGYQDPTNGKWLETVVAGVGKHIGAWELERCEPYEVWAAREGLAERDSGVDCIGTKKDGTTVAIQCKSHLYTRRGRPRTLGQRDVGKFLQDMQQATAFGEKWLVTNTIGVTPHVEAAEAWGRVRPEVFNICDALEMEIQRREEQTAAQTPRMISRQAMQDEAVRECVVKLAALREAKRHSTNDPSARGRLILPCGTGKTGISARIMEALSTEDDLNAVLCPSIGLVGQIREEYQARTGEPFEGLTVCSDAQVAGREKADATETDPTWDNSYVRPGDLQGMHAKSADEITTWLKTNANGGKRRVIFGTYQSGHHIAKALRDTGEKIKVLICDEAHRTAGIKKAPASREQQNDVAREFTLCHRQEDFPATYRVYQTATPRTYSQVQQQRVQDPEWIVRTMDDRETFGEELYRKKYGEAVDNGWLCDYRIIAVAVSDAHAMEIARGHAEEALNTAKKTGGKGVKNAMTSTHYLRGLAWAIALAGGTKGNEGERAGLKSCIAFMNTVNKSKAMTAFVNDDQVKEYLEGYWKEHSLEGAPSRYRGQHLDASSRVGTRRQELGKLASATPSEPRAISNVGIFGEGTDMRALDAVAFLEARKSPIDVIQAVGRAMRLSPDKGYGYVIVPIVIPYDTDAETWLATSKGDEGWEELGQILRALREHDERIEDSLQHLLKVYVPKPPDTERVCIGIAREGDGRNGYYEWEGELGRAESLAKSVAKKHRTAQSAGFVVWDEVPAEPETRTARRIITANAKGGTMVVRRRQSITKSGPHGRDVLDREKTKDVMRKMLRGKDGNELVTERNVVCIAAGGTREPTFYEHEGPTGQAIQAARRVATGETEPEKVGLHPVGTTPEEGFDHYAPAGALVVKESSGKIATEWLPGPWDKDNPLPRMREKARKALPKMKPQTREARMLDLVDGGMRNAIRMNILEQSGIGASRGRVDANIIRGCVVEGARYLERDKLGGALDKAFGYDKLKAKGDKGAPRHESTKVGALVLTLAMMHQARLEKARETQKWTGKRLKEIQAMPGEQAIAAVEDGWERITKHDYVQMFRPAQRVIREVRATGRTAGLGHCLKYLAEKAADLAGHYVRIGSDHIGPVYNQFMQDKKSDGAWFTRPVFATLAAELGLDALGAKDWRSEQTWRETRIIDLACGSGTLLGAALKGMEERAKQQGATKEEAAKRRRDGIEGGVRGFDINPVSLQLAASQLTLGTEVLNMERMHLYRMEYGEGADGTPRAGTLELLGCEGVMRKEEGESEQTKMAVPLEDGRKFHAEEALEADLVVMNPPFTSRDKMGAKFKDRSMTDKLRARVDELETWLKDGDPLTRDITDQNTTQPLYVALAEHCLKRNEGVLSMVMPYTALTSTSGAQQRHFLAARFHVEYIVMNFAERDGNMSEEVDVTECIVVCRRRKKGDSGRGTAIVKLDKVPESEIEARRMVRTLKESGQIDEWGEIGQATYEDIQNGDWSAAIWRSQTLANAAKTLRQDVQLRKLSQYGTPKETGRQVRGGGWREAEDGETQGMPVAKGKGAKEQGRVTATTALYVPQETNHEKQKKRIRNMEDNAGHLLVTAGHQMSSAAVTAMVAETRTIGNGWFPVPGLDIEQAKCAAVWLNSSYGRTDIMQSRAGKSIRFPSYSAKHINELVVPDLEDEGIVLGLASVYDEIPQEDVGRCDAGHTDIRQRWDEAVERCVPSAAALKDMGLGQELAREPCIAGRGRREGD